MDIIKNQQQESPQTEKYMLGQDLIRIKDKQAIHLKTKSNIHFGVFLLACLKFTLCSFFLFLIFKTKI